MERCSESDVCSCLIPLPLPGFDICMACGKPIG